MVHKSSSSVGYRILRVAAIAVLLAFLAFNIALWTHIKQQEVTISELQTKIAALKQHKAMEELNWKSELRKLSYEELFRRIDDNR